LATDLRGGLKHAGEIGFVSRGEFTSERPTGANDSGAPTMEVLGNSVSVVTGYTPWTNEMVTRTEGSGNSTTNLQNLSYAWDLNGNMLSRVDNRQSLTESFTLDGLNRLSTVKLNGVQTLSALRSFLRTPS
jgi:hypothetical protein